MKRLYKNLVMMCLACLVGMLASCSGSDYLNAIPKKVLHLFRWICSRWLPIFMRKTRRACSNHSFM